MLTGKVVYTHRQFSIYTPCLSGLSVKIFDFAEKKFFLNYLHKKVTGGVKRHENKKITLHNKEKTAFFLLLGEFFVILQRSEE